MDIFEFELKNHIEFELQGRNCRRLFEKLGYPTDVFDFSKGFIEIVKKQIRNTQTGKKQTITYTEKDFKSNIPFIEKYKITIETSIENGETGSEGGFNDKESVIYLHNGNLFLYPVIHIEAYSEDKFELKNEIFSSVGHELTHGYSEYMTLKSKRKLIENLLLSSDNNSVSVVTLMLAVKDKTEMEYYINNNFLANPLSSFDKIFARMAYISSEPERRAQISELRHELELKRDKIKDSESATQAVMDSSVYDRNYTWLNDKIDETINIVIDNKNRHLYGMIIRSFNRVFNKNYNNVDKIVVYLNNIRNEYNIFFMKKSMKIVQDIIDMHIAASGYVNKRSTCSFQEALDEANSLYG